ncbi:Dam family site-specific DNA-(adenine-N6)-methyltransferase [bacterium]|nr:Dam family site-specific DNA-(adenine-N6)-methyltransferase [bacterium]
MKTFLRWAGSKKQLLPILSEYWKFKSFSKYIEPFAGSASLFFHIKPDKAVICDINEDLIDTLTQIKNNPLRISHELNKLVNSKDDYYRTRALNPRRLSPTKKAARFIYLNRFCFNGLHRTNLNGEFNVPYGGARTGSLPSVSVLKSCSEILKNATLISGDFEKSLEKVNRNDFVYLDPPYSTTSVRMFKEYNSSLFSVKDLYRLRKYLDNVSLSGAFFVVSYASTRESEILSNGFFVEQVEVRRNMAGFAYKRKKVHELLISNFKIKNNRFS